MSTKNETLIALRAQKASWEEWLSTIDIDKAIRPVQTNGWSIKDVLAHLHAWQQVSNARLTAALDGGEPRLPGWLEGGDPESEIELDAYNERIYQAYRQLPWEQVLQAWRVGFACLIESAERIAETDLLDEKKFAWLNSSALMAVLQGTLSHHAEHLAELMQHIK